MDSDIPSKDLQDAAQDIRRSIIGVAHKCQCPHVGSALSCVDILTVLYFDVLNLEPWGRRDICILSKGHASLALCCTLAKRGIINDAVLNGYFVNNGTLPAHLDRFTAKGIEVSSGALGHGFNVGLGIAFGFKKKNQPRKVYTVIGDGESQEGSIWEGALFAPKFDLGNFTAIMDYNNLQGYGRARDICSFEPVNKKWAAFGWHVIDVDGHNHKSIRDALHQDSCGKPKMIIAHTTKGRGVSFMEDRLEWHYYIVADEHKEKALKELR